MICAHTLVQEHFFMTIDIFLSYFYVIKLHCALKVNDKLY